MFHAFHGYSRKNIQQERDNCLQFEASKANPFKGAVYTAAATPFGRIGTVRKPYEPLCVNIFRNMSCNSSQGSFLKSFLFFSAAFCQILFAPAASQTVQVFPVDGRSGGSPLVQRDQRVEVEDFRPWT